MRAANPRLDIDLAAIVANFTRLASAAPAAEPAAVVKCDAYGLGAAAVARTLAAKSSCRTFFVAYSEEGAALRAAMGPAPDIFVFNGPFADTIATYRDHRLTPVLNSIEQGKLWASSAPGIAAALHIDTGMNRLGLAISDAAEARTISDLSIGLVMSHLACASDATNAMNERQRRDFDEAAALFPSAKRSLSSSGGALFGARYGYDVLRLGVGLYGVNPHDAPVSGIASVATLTAPVIQCREIAGGESVGYGATFTSKRRTRLATVALGYGDGLPRSGSNSARAFVGGAICPVAGRISMDLIVLDVSDAPLPVGAGDRAEFFGLNLSIDDQAARCGTLGYELLTGVGGLSRARNGGLGLRVERRYLFGGAPASPSLTGAEGTV
ncbi:MAG: alanine racemase [Parvularculaceae bacterium]|nr:alanine racemase [Parvularculaceae bacterium]